MNPYRARYHRELDELVSDTRELANRVDIAIGGSIEALKEFDSVKAREIIKMDQAVDELNLKVESRCMELLALQQPMAKDLRLIIAVIKIGIDLERIGDLAVDIARIPVQNQGMVTVKRLENLPIMAAITRDMLHEAVRAIIENNAEVAREATKRDYEIDNLYVKVRDRRFAIMVENPMLVNDATALLMANRHLERIGDHICNICESIIYMIQGVREHLN